MQIPLQIPLQIRQRREVRFSAIVKQQLYGGASELLEIDCGGQTLRVKIPARGPLSGKQDFSFFAQDAVRVTE